jgi:hypothetical protein
VPIKLGFTEFTFDVALKGSDNRIVVVECKAYSEPNRVKQGDISRFANEVRLLRTKTLANVAGIFFTKSGYQVGAVKHAAWEEIEIAVCSPKASLDHIFLTYYRYDPVADKQVRYHVDYASIAFREDMRMLTTEEASAISGLSVDDLNEAIASRALRLRSVAADNQKRILLAELNQYLSVDHRDGNP